MRMGLLGRRGDCGLGLGRSCRLCKTIFELCSIISVYLSSYSPSPLSTHPALECTLSPPLTTLLLTRPGFDPTNGARPRIHQTREMCTLIRGREIAYPFHQRALSDSNLPVGLPRLALEVRVPFPLHALAPVFALVEDGLHRVGAYDGGFLGGGVGGVAGGRGDVVVGVDDEGGRSVGFGCGEVLFYDRRGGTVAEG
jgi:hypothetical protein